MYACLTPRNATKWSSAIWTTLSSSAGRFLLSPAFFWWWTGSVPLGRLHSWCLAPLPACTFDRCLWVFGKMRMDDWGQWASVSRSTDCAVQRCGWHVSWILSTSAGSWSEIVEPQATTVTAVEAGRPPTVMLTSPTLLLHAQIIQQMPFIHSTVPSLRLWFKAWPCLHNLQPLPELRERPGSAVPALYDFVDWGGSSVACLALSKRKECQIFLNISAFSTSVTLSWDVSGIRRQKACFLGLFSFFTFTTFFSLTFYTHAQVQAHNSVMLSSSSQGTRLKVLVSPYTFFVGNHWNTEHMFEQSHTGVDPLHSLFPSPLSQTSARPSPQ